MHTIIPFQVGNFIDQGSKLLEHLTSVHRPVWDAMLFQACTEAMLVPLLPLCLGALCQLFSLFPEAPKQFLFMAYI